MSLLATAYDPTVDIGTSISTLGAQLGSTITTALPYAVGLFAAFVGWRYVRRLVK